ncbi:hypothetical protein NC652_013746 [Populus alba x Populus x berolinensis]|nr:hypothetical protein NC652_013746 [Populus alba x Populus x berolinensis]
MKCPNYNPVSLRSSLSFSGHLAELERKIELNASTPASSSNVVVDNLRASMQIIDVASILGLDCDVSGHAFHLFRDCCSATCLGNRTVEACCSSSRSSDTKIDPVELISSDRYKQLESKSNKPNELARGKEDAENTGNSSVHLHGRISGKRGNIRGDNK